MGLLCELASTKSGEALHNQQFMGTKTAAFMPFLRASRITTALEWLRAVLIKGWWLGVGVGVGGVWVGEGGGEVGVAPFHLLVLVGSSMVARMEVAQRCCSWRRFVARSHPSGLRFVVWTSSSS